MATETPHLFFICVVRVFQIHSQTSVTPQPLGFPEVSYVFFDDLWGGCPAVMSRGSQAVITSVVRGPGVWHLPVPGLVLSTWSQMLLLFYLRKYLVVRTSYFFRAYYCTGMCPHLGLAFHGHSSSWQ